MSTNDNDKAIPVKGELEWTTGRGVRRVVVDAEVSERGNVYVTFVVDPSTGGRIYPREFQTAERLSLYESVRRAAGICGTCAGQQRVVRITKTNAGRPEEIREKCPTCDGTGRAKKP